MPIYEFQCNQCENEFEKLVFNTSEKIACPKCKKGIIGFHISVLNYHGLPFPVSRVHEARPQVIL